MQPVFIFPPGLQQLGRGAVLPGQQQKSVELLKYNGLVGAPVVRRPHIRMAIRVVAGQPHRRPCRSQPYSYTGGHTGRSRTPWYRRPYQQDICLSTDYGGKVLFEVLFVAGHGDAVYAVGGQRG